MIIPARRAVLRCTLAMLLPALTAACSQGSSSGSTVASPSPPTKTESFSGTLAQTGSAVHTFTVSATGTTSIAFTDVAPLATMSLGVSLGTYSSSVCTVVSTVNDARAGSTALSGTAAAGSYCVKVFDSGNIMQDTAVTYTVQVVHP